MALTVATNTGALMAQAAASSVNKEMEISMERLSTGKRINGASDDAAGVAIASRLTSEIRGTNQAIRNALDAQALIDTAEGAHVEIETLLQRIREVAVQAANDTNNATDRTALQTEVNALSSEIDRIAANSSWAGEVLLNGAGSLGTVHTTADTSRTFNFHVGSDNAGTADTISAVITAMDAASLAVSGETTVSITNGTVSGTTTSTLAVSVTNDTTASDSTYTILTVGTGGTASDAYAFEVDGVDISITNSESDTYAANTTGSAHQIADAIQAKIDSGDLASSYTVSHSGAVVTVKNEHGLDVSTNANAQSAINLIDAAIISVNTQRGTLGSTSNRLDSTVSNLTNISANLSAGKGRIEDADFAAETTNLAKAQILQQASTAMLAQANASKQNVLSLLQG